MPMYTDIHILGRCWCKLWHRDAPIFSDVYGLLQPEYTPTQWSPDVQDVIDAVYDLMDLTERQSRKKSDKNDLEWAVGKVRMLLFNADMYRRK